MSTSYDRDRQKPPVTPSVIEDALDSILLRLPSWALRHARQRIGTARDPWGCVLRACLLAYLKDTHDCSNLLGMYPEEIWVQGPNRPLKVTPPTWASALIRGLDEEKQTGEPITGTDVLLILERLGLLAVSNSDLWGQGALAVAYLREDAGPGQDRVYRPGGSQGAFTVSWTITIVPGPDERR